MFDRRNTVSTPSWEFVFSSTGCFSDSSDRVSICRVVAVMRNNARVCVCSNDICPPQTSEICSDPHIGRHFSARVSFLLFRSQNKKRVCPRRPRGCTFWGCDLRLSEYSILCYLIKCVWEQLAVFCSHDSLPLRKKQKKQKCRSAALPCPIFLFTVFPEGEAGMKNVKAVKVLQKWIILK